MQIKSNALVKFIVPAVVIAGLAVGLKSCKNEPAEQPQAKQSGSLKNLSPDELKALGWKATRRRTPCARSSAG